MKNTEYTTTQIISAISRWKKMLNESSTNDINELDLAQVSQGLGNLASKLANYPHAQAAAQKAKLLDAQFTDLMDEIQELGILAVDDGKYEMPSGSDGQLPF